MLGRLCGDPSVTQEHDTCSSLLLDLLHRLTEQVPVWSVAILKFIFLSELFVGFKGPHFFGNS